MDGHDARSVTIASLRAQFGVVFQDSFLFNISLRENIRLGRPDATDADVENAARAAEIHDFILSLPEKYDTLTGERGGAALRRPAPTHGPREGAAEKSSHPAAG